MGLGLRVWGFWVWGVGFRGLVPKSVVSRRQYQAPPWSADVPHSPLRGQGMIADSTKKEPDQGCLEGQTGLVSSLIMGVNGLVIWLMVQLAVESTLFLGKLDP